MQDWVVLAAYLAPTLAAIATLITAVRTRKEVGRVHVLVNSHKTLLEEQLASAVAEVRELKQTLRKITLGVEPQP